MNDTLWFDSIPVGLGMALMQNADAMTRFSNLSDVERRQILDRASRARSSAEMLDIVQTLAR